MKTDRFSDIIRRKLESIRPEFTEKDWTRMQSTLKQAGMPQPGSSGAGHPFSGGVWSGHPWLMAAATVSTVAVIAFSVWQRNEINQLRHTISELNQRQAKTQPVQPQSDLTSPKQDHPDVAGSDKNTSAGQPHEPTTLPNQKGSLPVRADTVYITRYVPVPSQPHLEGEAVEEKRAGQRSEAPKEQRYATATHTPVSTGAPTQTDNLTNHSKTDAYGVSSTPLLADKNANNSSTTTHNETNSLARNGSAGRVKKGRGAKGYDLYQPNSTDNQNNIVVDRPITPRRAQNEKVASQPTTVVDTPTSQLDDQNNKVVRQNTVTTDKPVIQPESPVTEASGTVAHYELLNSRSLSPKEINWNALVAQRARRMRPARISVPAVVAQPQMPTSQPVRLATRFRAGIGGEVTSSLWSAGIFTEVLLGQHWTVGVGLNQATYTSTFINDDDFYERMHRNFRNEFGPGIDPFRDILNINTRQVRLQIPVSLGYRIPLNQSLAILPTVGTYLNLSSAENVTYYCRQPPLLPQQIPRGFDQYGLSKSQSIDLVNSLTLGTGLEWHRSHWVVQASPVLTIPMTNNAKTVETDLNWKQNTTVSLRARLLYQF